MKHFLRTFLPVFFVSCSTAFALPRFTLMTGESCGSCHVNPTGGEMRNYFGTQQFSTNDLPMWKDSSFDFNTQLTSNISIGGDARTQFLAVDSLYSFSKNATGAGGGTFQPMQASLYLNVRFNDKFGLFMKEDFVTQPGSFEFWGIARILPNKGYIKAGAFQPAIGLRVDDHTSFTRYGDYTQNGEFWGMGIYPNSKSTGIEVGEYVSKFFIAASLTNGEFPEGNVGPNSAIPNFTANKTISGRIEYTNLFSDDFAIFLGGSGLANTTSGTGNAESTTLYDGFYGIRYGIVTLTGDYMIGKNTYATSGIDTATSTALMSELAVKATDGLYGILKYDMYQPDKSDQNNEVTRWTIGAEWYPVNFVEVIPQVRLLNSTVSQTNGSTVVVSKNPMKEFLLQTHFWF
ncbi:MAG TPA: hypothetical protein VFA55_02085 [Candidatus Kapabacteria bacterium]|nr:hypothetical protein [Candidatus Kapabacteria bacterium]